MMVATGLALRVAGEIAAMRGDLKITPPQRGKIIMQATYEQYTKKRFWLILAV